MRLRLKSRRESVVTCSYPERRADQPFHAANLATLTQSYFTAMAPGEEAPAKGLSASTMVKHEAARKIASQDHTRWYSRAASSMGVKLRDGSLKRTV